jgi:hypothetical protein
VSREGSPLKRRRRFRRGRDRAKRRPSRHPQSAPGCVCRHREGPTVLSVEAHHRTGGSRSRRFSAKNARKKPIRSSLALRTPHDIRSSLRSRGEGKGNVAVIAPYPVSLARTESRSGARPGPRSPPPPPRPCPAFRSPPSSRAPRAPAADSPPFAWREPRGPSRSGRTCRRASPSRPTWSSRNSRAWACRKKESRSSRASPPSPRGRNRTPPTPGRGACTSSPRRRR